MKLDRAIAIASASAYRGVTTFDEQYKDALKLLIEAGKRVKHVRTLHTPNPLDILPGETKDYIPQNIGNLPSDEHYENEVSK